MLLIIFVFVILTSRGVRLRSLTNFRASSLLPLCQMQYNYKLAFSLRLLILKISSQDVTPVLIKFIDACSIESLS